MNLQDLANLILIRNHIAFLINTERTIVTKEQIRPADTLKSELDRLILAEALNVDLEGIQKGGVPYTIVEHPNPSAIESATVNTVQTRINVTNKAVTVSPPEDAPEDAPKQLSLDFSPKTAKAATKPKVKTKKTAKQTKEEKEIAAKIAKAKKEVADKKAGGAFRRATD